MINNQRQQKILALLNKQEFVSVVELSDTLNVSSQTIRRDLEYFEQKRLVKRIHGGAIIHKTEHVLPPFYERIDKCVEEKMAIGKAAYSLVEANSIVCIDAGTTALSMVRSFDEESQFTVITTGLVTAAELCRFRNIELIQVGGLVHKPSFTVCSALATGFLSRFNADIAFLSTRALEVNKGTYDYNIALAEEKRVLMNVSKKVVILADYTKFSSNSLYLSIPLEEIDVVITDDKAPTSSIKQLQEANIEVIVVHP